MGSKHIIPEMVLAGKCEGLVRRRQTRTRRKSKQFQSFGKSDICQFFDLLGLDALGCPSKSSTELNFVDLEASWKALKPEKALRNKAFV